MYVVMGPAAQCARVLIRGHRRVAGALGPFAMLAYVCQYGRAVGTDVPGGGSRPAPASGDPKVDYRHLRPIFVLLNVDHPARKLGRHLMTSPRPADTSIFPPKPLTMSSTRLTTDRFYLNLPLDMSKEPGPPHLDRFDD